MPFLDGAQNLQHFAMKNGLGWSRRELRANVRAEQRYARLQPLPNAPSASNGASIAPPKLSFAAGTAAARRRLELRRAAQEAAEAEKLAWAEAAALLAEAEAMSAALKAEDME